MTATTLRIGAPSSGVDRPYCFEQAHARLLGNAPALSGKVIPYWVTLAAVDESGRIDVDAIDPPTNVGGRSSTHFVGIVGVILGGKSRLLERSAS